VIILKVEYQAPHHIIALVVTHQILLFMFNKTTNATDSFLHLLDYASPLDYVKMSSSIEISSNGTRTSKDQVGWPELHTLSSTVPQIVKTWLTLIMKNADNYRSRSALIIYTRRMAGAPLRLFHTFVMFICKRIHV
jgi:hypothetical protein